ncbi:unnamed protein product [Rotaria socialis]|uniref:Uncharacterized protein n=2 Tax=Rotaria socialis TaxID=392032 RepID=A0A817V440_9BILA|nr:unnamed protein product [Rotaria socialis]
MQTGFCYISCMVLIITILNKIVIANEIKDVQFKPQSNSLLLAKELATNAIHLVHFQSALLIKASERDFPFNIPSNSTVNYIRYPQSYRTTMVQFSSDMYKTFFDTYSTMQRIQLAVERVPNCIKTLLRLLTTEPSAMIQRLLTVSLNSMVRLSNENMVLITKTIDQLTNLLNFSNEINQYSINSSPGFNGLSSDKTDLMLYNEFNSKNLLEKISTIIHQIKKQFEHVPELIMSLDIKAKFNLTIHDKITSFIPALYTIESNSYFLHHLSSIYNEILRRYVLDQAASIEKHLLLLTDEERSKDLAKISQELENSLHNIKPLFIEREREFEINNMALQQAYEKLRNEYQERSWNLLASQ